MRATKLCTLKVEPNARRKAKRLMSLRFCGYPRVVQSSTPPSPPWPCTAQGAVAEASWHPGGKDPRVPLCTSSPRCTACPLSFGNPKPFSVQDPLHQLRSLGCPQHPWLSQLRQNLDFRCLYPRNGHRTKGPGFSSPPPIVHC